MDLRIIERLYFSSRGKVQVDESGAFLQNKTQKQFGAVCVPKRTNAMGQWYGWIFQIGCCTGNCLCFRLFHLITNRFAALSHTQTNQVA